MQTLKIAVENFLGNGEADRTNLDDDVRNFMRDVTPEQGWTEADVRAAFNAFYDSATSDWTTIQTDTE